MKLRSDPATYRFRDEVERALTALEPTKPQRFYDTTDASLPEASLYPNCICISDGRLVLSTGSAWVNADGSAI